MRIGIDIRNIGKKRTGDEAVFFNLVKNLAIIDKKNKYSLFTDIPDTSILHNMEASLEIENNANFKIISLKTGNRFAWNFWTLQHYLRRNPVDVYLTQYITPLFVPKKVKIAAIIHDISFNFYPEFIKFSDLFFLKILIPRSLKRADKIIAVSQFTRDEIIQKYKIDPAKVDFIYNAVSGDFMKGDTNPDRLEAVRKKYNLPEKFILYLGTMQPRKNLPTLIRAYALLPGDIQKKFKLVMAGGRGYNFDKKITEATQKFAIKDSVYFPGFIAEADKPAIFKLAGFFVFPSLYEGFGIPVLEAMAAGTPVIASRVRPHLEIAENAALFFDAGNPNDLLEKMQKFFNNANLRNEFVRRGREQAGKFSWLKTAEKTFSILSSLA